MLRERIIQFLEERRQKVLEGGVNCIPIPFTRFRSDLPGLEQGCYYLISGSTKSGKTQLTNYLFVFNTILYCFYNPDRVYPKIFYFPLEETAELITLRFMSFLLNHLTNGRIRISPTDLKSTDERKPVPQEVLDFMETEPFVDIMALFEQIVTFDDARNPTGIMKIMKSYAANNGTIHHKKVQMRDELGQMVEREVFDYYEANNPDEYVFIIVDHVSLLDPESGLKDKDLIIKFSKYMVELRNRYNYSPVVVQQQSIETQSLEAFKNNKIRPTVAGLSDSKYTGRDCQVMLGITNPSTYELSTYLDYNIKTFKGNIRFVEVVTNRNGIANGVCPLLFEGEVCAFKELPKPNETEKLQRVYNYLNNIRSTSFFNFNNNFINKFVHSKFKSYLCTLFHFKH